MSHLFHVDNGGALRWRDCLAGLVYVQDERYAAGAGMRRIGQAHPCVTRYSASSATAPASPEGAYSWCSTSCIPAVVSRTVLESNPPTPASSQCSSIIRNHWPMISHKAEGVRYLTSGP